MKIIPFVLLLIPFIVRANAESSTLEIHPIKENVYQHVSYLDVKPWGLVAANGLVVIEQQHAYIVDTPWTVADTRQLVSWIKSQGLVPKAALVSHFHQDASNGIAYLNEVGIETYASSLTNTLLAKQNRPQSSKSFTGHTLTLANNSIEIFSPGAGHTKDNVVIWLQRHNLLFGGCFVKSLESKGLGNIADASVEKWPKSLNNVLKKYPKIEQVVPGHGKIGDVKLLSHTVKLARTHMIEKTKKPNGQ
ncbi:subclass B1 metallo-beta-lactamase [Pseudoalteromonas sp. MMG022]|uniref:subclass B1 metallo-beta-lactamase n=1 Tax=Pseudoalteromonas sp. MMG022 TaxID=2909978 RepID=UPI001EFFB5D7|nr:subclass B1 metallo-beta-lactamase [Pseudoalteromonas sp. MMG022]MCF6436668.1 subclass B1 metallo-beta-lactamase [Pseudoalteromonas sp. MMG022]